MNTERAITGLTMLGEILEPLLLEANFEGQGENDVKELKEDLNLATESLKRQQWTPVEKGLPEEYEYVLVWHEYKVMKGEDEGKMRQAFEISYHIKGFWGRDVTSKLSRCIAWMPLPEPYKEKNNE